MQIALEMVMTLKLPLVSMGHSSSSCSSSSPCSALACAILHEALSSCNNALETTASWSDLTNAVADVLIARDPWMALRQGSSTHARMSAVLMTCLCFDVGDEQWSNEEGDHTMVKVLCSQRDRFRDKAHQLELQLAQVCKDSANN